VNLISVEARCIQRHLRTGSLCDLERQGTHSPGDVRICYCLFHFHEGYFGFEDLEDLYLKTQQGIRFAVIKNFFTALQANVNYDNTPSPGFYKTDTTLLFGLGYNFDL
jgi:hypothetical protein